MTEKDKAITSTMLFNTDEFGNRGMDVETLREYNDQKWALKQSFILTERINEDVEKMSVSVGEKCLEVIIWK